MPLRSYSENRNKKFQIQGGANVPLPAPVSALVLEELAMYTRH